MKKRFFLFVIILAIVALIIILYFTFKKPEKINNISFSIDNIKNIVFILDGRSNTIYFFDTVNNKFLENSFQIDDPEYYESCSISLAPNGNLYVPMSPHMDYRVRLKNPEAYVAVIDSKKPQITTKITSDLWPQYMAIAPNGKAYFTHSFMYEDGSGWAVSILDTNTNKVTKQIKIPGAPGIPKLLEDNQIYIPIMGGGKEHFGNSNLLIMNTENDEFSKYYPDDFSELPPHDMALYNNQLISMFFAAENSNGHKPDLIKLIDFTNPAFKRYFAIKDEGGNIILKEIPISLQGGGQFVINGDNAFIAYFDSISGQGGGLMVYDLKNDLVIKDVALKDRTFLKKMILYNNKIYFNDSMNKGIFIIDPKTYEINNITLPNGAYLTDLISSNI